MIQSDLFRVNKYFRWYNTIIDRSIGRNWRKSKCKSNGLYVEQHHIIPKSLGGVNTKENLTLLTAREHFITHLLLPKFVIGTLNIHKMNFALVNLMVRNKHQQSNRHEIRSSRIYAIIRKANSVASAERGRGKSPNGGKVTYHNPLTSAHVFIKKDQPIPNGYIRGKSLQSKLRVGECHKGRVHFYNSQTGKLLFLRPGESPPDGFIKGNPHCRQSKAGGTIWIHNPTTFQQNRIAKLQSLPRGFVCGSLEIWITDRASQQYRKHNRYLPIPDGCDRGRPVAVVQKALEAAWRSKRKSKSV